MQLSLELGGDAMPQGGRPGRFEPAAVLDLLQAWQQAGWLRLLDLQFARFLHHEKPDAPGLLLLAAALTSHQLGRGHVCLELAATLEGPERVLNLPPDQAAARAGPGAAPSPVLPPVLPAELLARLRLDDWEAAFREDEVSDGSQLAPLVYDSGRLYLYRYWRYEQQVAKGIAQRLVASERAAGPEPAQVKSILDQLFTSQSSGPDWQRMACALAARQQFSIVTGGPGTGKTTTVVKLLALLQALHLQQWQGSLRSSSDHEHSERALHGSAVGAWQPLRIRLAAPTGKAAARLSESIAGKLSELPWPELGGEALVQSIPTQVVTLHKLLGGRPHVSKRTYHADHPLPLDVLVIDEASMVSLSDMADVIAALPGHARLVLIGDKDQLSSVEAGAVLGELCQRANEGHYLPVVAAWLKAATGMAVPDDMQCARGRRLDQAVAMLRFSHRFGHDSGIGNLALAVNDGRVDAVQGLLASPRPDLAHVQIKDTHDQAFARLVVQGWAASPPAQADDRVQRQGYGQYLALVARGPEREDHASYEAWAAQVLQAHRAFQILCVLRNGPWGVEGLNSAIARILHSQGLIPAMAGWYAGRPVMVTRNNRTLQLSNGDIGVVLPYLTSAGQPPALRVAFPDGEGVGVRWFAPNRLDDVETVYALTVHKSQGSEFQHTALVLPQAPTPVLTRELLYTGITRASRWFTLVNPGGAGLLRQAVAQRIYRSGGLGDLLTAME